MIRLRFAEVLSQRGLVHGPGRRQGQVNMVKAAPYLDMTYPQLHGIMKSGRGITLATLDRLCNRLGVTPGDLIEYFPDDPNAAIYVDTGDNSPKPYVALEW